MKLVDDFYAAYYQIQKQYYTLMKTNLVFRVVTILFFCVAAPLIVILLYIPSFIQELVEFYRWVPQGLLKGVER